MLLFTSRKKKQTLDLPTTMARIKKGNGELVAAAIVAFWVSSIMTAHLFWPTDTHQ